MQIEVKNIKSFVGQEGHCLQGTLYIDGVARGMVSDDSHGGPMRFDDHKAEMEITEYAKGFPSEYDFMHAEILVSTIMQRTVEGKRLGAMFDKSLCFVDTDGKVGMTKAIKGDITKTRAAWMANPQTAKNLKVARYLTDKNEFIELIFAENPNLQHPALEVKAAKKVVEEKKPQPVEEEVKPEVVVKEKKFSAEKSKLELCRDVYNDPANINKARGEMIKLFISVAGCTPAGASTYYQKLKTS